MILTDSGCFEFNRKVLHLFDPLVIRIVTPLLYLLFDGVSAYPSADPIVCLQYDKLLIEFGKDKSCLQSG